MSIRAISTSSKPAFTDEKFNLFSLPEIYVRVRKLMDNPDSSFDDFADAVKTDPNLTYKILGMVNSPFFGFSGQIDTITRALNFIGLGQFHDLVLTMSVLKSFDGIPNELIDMPAFWRRNVYCGVLSSLIAEKCNIPDSERLFVAGVLHEIGHLILFSELPSESREALLRSEHENRPLFKIERDIMGIHYGQVGKQLMQRWNFPENIQEITECHTEPEKAKQYTRDATIVHIAHAFAHEEDFHDKLKYIVDNVDPFAWQTTTLTPETILLLVKEAEQKSAELMKQIVGKSAC